MCQSECDHVLNAVLAVQAIEGAQKRIGIDVPTRPGVTYFSQKDIWLYQMNEIPTTCQDCKGYEDLASSMGGLNGNFIRSLFPYLVIQGEDTIGGPGEGGKGLAHPNCGCLLVRKHEES